MMKPAQRPLTDREKLGDLTIALNNVTKVVLSQAGVHSAIEAVLMSVVASHPNPIQLAHDMMGRIERVSAVLHGDSVSEETLEAFQGTTHNLLTACRRAMAAQAMAAEMAPPGGAPPSPETPPLH